MTKDPIYTQVISLNHTDQLSTSKALLHLVWNSQVKPTLLVRLELEYSLRRAVNIEQATSCWKTNQQNQDIKHKTYWFYYCLKNTNTRTIKVYIVICMKKNAPKKTNWGYAALRGLKHKYWALFGTLLKMAASVGV